MSAPAEVDAAAERNCVANAATRLYAPFVTALISRAIVVYAASSSLTATFVSTAATVLALTGAGNGTPVSPYDRTVADASAGNDDSWRGVRTTPPSGRLAAIETNRLPLPIDVEKPYGIFDVNRIQRAYGNCTVRFGVPPEPRRAIETPNLYVWYKPDEWVDIINGNFFDDPEPTVPHREYYKALRKAVLAERIAGRDPIAPPVSDEPVTEGAMLAEERPLDYREFRGRVVPIRSALLRREILASVVDSEIRRWFPHLGTVRHDNDLVRSFGSVSKPRIHEIVDRGGLFHRFDYCSVPGELDFTARFADLNAAGVKKSVLATMSENKLLLRNDTQWRVSFGNLNARLRYWVERTAGGSYDFTARSEIRETHDAIYMTSLPLVVSHEIGHFFGIFHHNDPSGGSEKWRELREPKSTMLAKASIVTPWQSDPTFAFDRAYRRSLHHLFSVWWAYDRYARLVGPRNVYWISRDGLARLYDRAPQMRDHIETALRTLEKRAAENIAAAAAANTITASPSPLPWKPLVSFDRNATTPSAANATTPSAASPTVNVPTKRGGRFRKRRYRCRGRPYLGASLNAKYPCPRRRRPRARTNAAPA